MQRWLDSGEANKIWSKISGSGPFNSGDAFNFVRFVLFLRRGATQTDQANQKMPIVARERNRLAIKARKHALRKLANEDITPDQLAAFEQAVEEMLRRSAAISDPLFGNRSDNRGSRQRTIFCRALSDFLHDARGKWHDAEVEQLCQIAFDYGGDVDARSARRESTRKRNKRTV
jgi:hypothetical protein